MKNYKVGDKVILLDNKCRELGDMGRSFRIGGTYTIQKLSKFDTRVNLVGRDGWVLKKNIKLAKKTIII